MNNLFKLADKKNGCAYKLFALRNLISKHWCPLYVLVKKIRKNLKYCNLIYKFKQYMFQSQCFWMKISSSKSNLYTTVYGIYKKVKIIISKLLFISLFWPLGYMFIQIVVIMFSRNMFKKSTSKLAQLAGAAEYANCNSTEW